MLNVTASKFRQVGKACSESTTFLRINPDPEEFTAHVVLNTMKMFLWPQMNNFSPLSDVRYLPPLRDSMQDNFSYKSARVCAVSLSNKQNSNLIIFGKFPISENLIRTMPSRRAELKFSLEMNDIINCRCRSETTVPSSVRLKCK